MAQVYNFELSSKFDITLFNENEVSYIQNLVIPDEKGKKYQTIKCIIRNKEIKPTKEEIVRQLFIYRLINIYKYSKEFIQLEYPIQFGVDNSKRADKEISDKIEKSFGLRKQSKHLLDIAVKSVEIAIEKSEQEAINFINKNIK
jgi:hypothetical protein